MQRSTRMAGKNREQYHIVDQVRGQVIRSSSNKVELLKVLEQLDSNCYLATAGGTVLEVGKDK